MGSLVTVEEATLLELSKVMPEARRWGWSFVLQPGVLSAVPTGSQVWVKA